MSMSDYITRKQRTMKPSEQRLIVAAREDRAYWRGEDIETFKLVYEETQKMRSMGSRAYREQAMGKLKQLVGAMA